MDERDEDHENNIMAAGGVYMKLLEAGGLEPEIIFTEDGFATNAMSVKPHYMKSRYRVTVERIPDEEEE